MPWFSLLFACLSWRDAFGGSPWITWLTDTPHGFVPDWGMSLLFAGVAGWLCLRATTGLVRGMWILFGVDLLLPSAERVART